MIIYKFMNLQPLTFNLVTVFSLLAFILSACGPATPTAEPQIVDVYATSAAQPWLTKLYACAANSGTVLKVNAESPEIYLRVGEPDVFVFPTYQIDEEDLIVVMNYARPPLITGTQIKELFTGKISNLNHITSEWGEVHVGSTGEVHVWVYSSDDDIQKTFEQIVLSGSTVTSQAHVAANPQDMLNQIAKDENSIGYLPRHWLGNGVFEQAVVATVPVLAVTKSEPQGLVVDLISCLQNN